MPVPPPIQGVVMHRGLATPLSPSIIGYAGYHRWHPDAKTLSILMVLAFKYFPIFPSAKV